MKLAAFYTHEVLVYTTPSSPQKMASSTSAQEKAAMLNSSLPVHLTAADIEQYPEFGKLLSFLTSHLTENGMSTGVFRNFIEAQDALKQQKLKYLQNLVLYSQLKDLLMEYEIKCQTVVPGSSTTQLYNTLKNSLTRAEAAGYLDFNPEESGGNVTLLGLKPEHLLHKDAQKKSLHQNIIPELESRLKGKCEVLANFYEPSSESVSDSEGLSVAKANQLPILLEKGKRSLEEERKQLKREMLKRNTQFWQYHKALLQSLETLERLVTKYRMQSQPKYDTATADWLVAKCDAMCLKIKVLQNQLIKDTYTPEKITALSKIKHHLETEKEACSKELQHASQTLQAYESVGMGFDSLVKQYSVLMAEIDNKTWALRELRQTDPHEQLNDLWTLT